MKAAILILALSASPEFAATEYLCDGMTGQAKEDGSLMRETVKSAAAAFRVIDMGDHFIIGTPDWKTQLVSPALGERNIAAMEGGAFSKDGLGYYVYTPGLINAAINCKPVVKS